MSREKSTWWNYCPVQLQAVATGESTTTLKAAERSIRSFESGISFDLGLVLLPIMTVAEGSVTLCRNIGLHTTGTTKSVEKCVRKRKVWLRLASISIPSSRRPQCPFLHLPEPRQRWSHLPSTNLMAKTNFAMLQCPRRRARIHLPVVLQRENLLPMPRQARDGMPRGWSRSDLARQELTLFACTAAGCNLNVFVDTTTVTPFSVRS